MKETPRMRAETRETPATEPTPERETATARGLMSHEQMLEVLTRARMPRSRELQLAMVLPLMRLLTSLEKRAAAKAHRTATLALATMRESLDRGTATPELAETTYRATAEADRTSQELTKHLETLQTVQIKLSLSRLSRRMEV